LRPVLQKGQQWFEFDDRKARFTCGANLDAGHHYEFVGPARMRVSVRSLWRFLREVSLARQEETFRVEVSANELTLTSERDETVIRFQPEP
jgi:hypothetical protein